MAQPETTSSLTAQQQHACRRRTLDGVTLEDLAEEVGVSRTTLYRWALQPEWSEYEQSLKDELHSDIVACHRAVGRSGGRARLRAIRRLEAEIDACTDSKDLASLSNALDRLVTSAEDRSGYPRTDRMEHSGRDGGALTVDVSSLLALGTEGLRALANVSAEDE